MNNQAGAGAVAALALVGIGAYSEYTSVDKFKAETESKVIQHQKLHQNSVSEEQLLQTQVPQQLMETCRQQLKQCLRNLPVPENCENQLNLSPYNFYLLYGAKGLNQSFSAPATVCYNKVADSVDQCEASEIACLKGEIANQINSNSQ